ITGLALSTGLEILRHLGIYPFSVSPGLLALVSSLLVFLIVGRVETSYEPVRPAKASASMD
ncbi:MAG: hypothetical protein P8Y94_14985, partial [Acidobacteriota bacterium]